MIKIGKIVEGFYEKDTTLYFDPKQNAPSNYVDTSLGKRTESSAFIPRLKTIKIDISNSSTPKTVNIYSAYKKYSDVDDRPNILSTMKGLTDYNIDQNSFDKFMSRVGIFYANFILRNSIPVDILMTPQSSHDIAIKLKNDILSRLSDKSIQSLDNAIMKDISKLELDSKLMGNMPDDSQKKRAILAKFNKYKDGSVKFELKKLPVPFRKYFVNWMTLNPRYESVVRGKNIILIDDYLTTGTTIYVACKALFEKYGVNAITVFTITKPA